MAATREGKREPVRRSLKCNDHSRSAANRNQRHAQPNSCVGSDSPATGVLTVLWALFDRIGRSIVGAVGFPLVLGVEVAMAIKRPTKGKGTPSHKPVASAPLRHVDVRVPQQMVPGEVYVGWLCKNRSCGRVIAITDAIDGNQVSSLWE
jgi:hypothetical protein